MLVKKHDERPIMEPDNTNERLRVSIVEDDDDMRSRLAESVAARPELQLLAQYSSGSEALAGLKQQVPDVFLVDLGLGDMSGLEVIRYIAMQHPLCDVLVISVFGDEEHVLSALEAGARGYLLKGTLTRDITLDIQELRNGGSPLSPIIARQVLKRLNSKTDGKEPVSQDNEETLTPREIEILRLIARGFTYSETADLLNISMRTVHSHLKHIYRKLAVHSKTEAVFEADQRRLL